MMMMMIMIMMIIIIIIVIKPVLVMSFEDVYCLFGSNVNFSLVQFSFVYPLVKATDVDA